MSISKKLLYVVISIIVIVVLFVAYIALELPGSKNIVYGVMGQMITCEGLPGMSIREEPGPGFPGVADAPRWGIPDEAPTELRVRRSWTSLNDEEKTQFVDGILLMKMTKINSDLPGAERTDYQSICPSGQSYETNLLDYYVELHMSAFKTIGGSPENMMPHNAPHFLPWHRYLILRFEADMQTVLDDPTFTLPYWDWDDCEDGVGDGSNPCPAIFDEAFLGSHGGLEGNEAVKGYLIDQGYELNIWTEDGMDTLFNTDGVVCGARPLRRAVGTDDFTDPALAYKVPSSIETINASYARPYYDVEPYDACTTDDTQSLRMFIEGYRPNDMFPCYLDGRCGVHGMAHVYVGGDMSSGSTPADPMFFLHHANVDRVWAMWQQNNLDNDITEDYGNPAFPGLWRIPIFNYPDIMVDELFDFRSLGYTYDSIDES